MGAESTSARSQIVSIASAARLLIWPRRPPTGDRHPGDPLCTGPPTRAERYCKIVHDVAPGASLSFAIGVQWAWPLSPRTSLPLRQPGQKSSLTMFCTLPSRCSRMVSLLRRLITLSQGVTAYFSAAGNEARQSYQSTFRPGDFFARRCHSLRFRVRLPSLAVLHTISIPAAARDHFKVLRFPRVTTVLLSLQWDSPFFSVSGSPGTENDLDIYLLDSAAATKSCRQHF